MTSRPSTTVTGPWAALMTRSGRYRCFCLRSSISAATKASGSRVRVIRRSSRGFSPVHDHLARVAGSGRREGGFEVAEAEAVGDHGLDVEPGTDQHGHLVPGLVHLPPVDPAQRELVEHDRVHVEGDLAG